jgi:hypothetical protein
VGERDAVVITELAHDREGETQPPRTLLHTVNPSQQPFDTPHVSTSSQNNARTDWPLSEQ